LFEILDAQPDIDLLINMAVFDFGYHMMISSGAMTREAFIQEHVNRLGGIRRRVKKPFLSINFHVSENADMTAMLNRLRQGAREQGVPSFSSMERMTRAVRRLFTYLGRRDRGTSTTC
jgi:hypothetical protein